jgi:hypothetical protein
MKLAAFTTPPALIEGGFCAAERGTQIPPHKTAAVRNTGTRISGDMRTCGAKFMRRVLLAILAGKRTGVG